MNPLEAAIRRLSALPGQLEAASLSAAQQSAIEAARTAKALVPVETGALRASIAAEALPGGAAVRADQPYAGAVEMGHGRAVPRPYLLPAARWADYPRRAARNCQEVLK